MKRRREGLDKVVLAGVVLATLFAALVLRPKKSDGPAELEAVVVGDAKYKLDFRDGRILVSDAKRGGQVSLEATVLVDGTVRPLAGTTSGTDTARVVEVSAGAVKVKVSVRLEGGLLRVRVLDTEALAPHAVELRLATTPASSVWVPGAGELASGDAVVANAAIFEGPSHPLVVAAPFGARIALEPSHDSPASEDASLALDDDGGAFPDAGDAGDASDDDEPGERAPGRARLVVTTDRTAVPPPISHEPEDAGATKLDASSPKGRASSAPQDASLDAAKGASGDASNEAIDDLDAGDPDDDTRDDERASLEGDAGPSAAPVLAATGKKKARTELVVFLGASPEGTYGQLFRLLGQRVARVHGRVTGSNGRAVLYGVDDTGHPQVRAELGPEGTFDVLAPLSVDKWLAREGAAASTPSRFPPGTGWPLVLDMSPGGELEVRVTDEDTKERVPSRLWVHGVEGTLDPSFGPDFRASGAGPLVDVLDGELKTPVPKGRYRVEATHGLEWTIDAKTVDVTSGKRTTVDLSLRHVVPTPHLIGCDLHVHARPSFDSLVSVEDRVTTLVTAGVEFAVPTEHNIVGDYGPTIQALSLGKRFTSVTGVEVTTFGPRYGHFGVFPYPVDQKVPPYRQVRAGQMFEAARKGDPARVVQVNHPRLPKGIGYFTIVGFDPKSGVIPTRMRSDFDTIEVYNGYEIQNPAQVETVLKDWLSLLAHGHKYAATGSSDSHTVQYNWAGYPRTLVRIEDPSGGAPGHPPDPKGVVAAIKAGRSIVTSGPVIELTVEGGRPGDDVTLPADRESTTAHLVVRAAPWVDVTDVELLVDGRTFFRKAVESRPTGVGREPGTLAEAQARSVRFESDVTLPLAAGTHFVVAAARGARKADDVLPFMPFQPMGFTNPVWVTRPVRNSP